MTRPNTSKALHCVKQMKHHIPSKQNYSWANVKHLYNYLRGKVGSRGNFPQTAGTTQRIVGTYVHSIAQGKDRGRQRYKLRNYQASHFIRIKLRNSPYNRSYETTDSFGQIMTKIIPILRHASTNSLI
jgi:hypothetical protein